jgi:hypothetical protein
VIAVFIAALFKQACLKLVLLPGMPAKKSDATPLFFAG